MKITKLESLTTTRRGLLTAAVSGLALSTFPILGARAETPKKGGHLVLGVDGATTTQSLDPGTFSQSHDQITGSQIYNQLIQYDTGKLEPALAESWESKPDLKTWIIKLRKGVQFHNGKAMTSADVVYSLNHHRGEKTTSAAKPVVANIADIKATGANEVTVTLATADIDFPYVLSTVHLCIVPEGSEFTDGVGTGPYVLKKFDPGVSMYAERNPNYWRSDRAFVDSVDVRGVNDVTARLNGLLGGELHLINRPDPKNLQNLMGQDGFQVFNIPGRGFYNYTMLSDAGVYANNDLRLALKYSMDRQEVIDKAASGFGGIANDHPIAPSDPMFSADVPQRHYDPDKASFHFKKSGFSGRVPVTSSEVFAGATDAGLLLQQSAKKAGIDIDLSTVPVDGFMDRAFGKLPCIPDYWNGRPTANMILTLAYHSKAPWNAGHLKDAQLDQLIEASRSEADEPKRKQMYHDMQVILNERGSDLTYMFFNVQDAANKNVKGFVPMAHAELSGLRASEKVWLEG